MLNCVGMKYDFIRWYGQELRELLKNLQRLDLEDGNSWAFCNELEA